MKIVVQVHVLILQKRMLGRYVVVDGVAKLVVNGQGIVRGAERVFQYVEFVLDKLFSYGIRKTGADGQQLIFNGNQFSRPANLQ